MRDDVVSSNKRLKALGEISQPHGEHFVISRVLYAHDRDHKADKGEVPFVPIGDIKSGDRRGTRLARPR